LSVDFSRVAVSHSPFPAICWKEVTHRSTATGVKNAVSVPRVAFVGQPEQAAPPVGIIGPPGSIGIGVALADDPGTDPGAEPEAEAEPEAAADAPLAGSFTPPGLAAAVPHPAASAPATSTGRE
jgi:hypothetical protein